MGGGGESAENTFRAMKDYLLGHNPANMEEMRCEGGGAAGRDGAGDQGLHGGVALVEVAGQQLQAGVAVQAQRELRQVVRADREAVEVIEELVGEVQDATRRR